MGQSKDCCHGGSLTWFRFNMEAAAGTFRGIFEKWNPKPDLPGGPGGKEGSVTWAACSGVIPHPLSAMTMVSLSALVSAVTRMVTSEAPARVEFSDTSNTFREISVIIGLVVLG